MTNKKKLDPVSEAARSMIEIESKRYEIAEAEQKKRELLISQTYRMMGRIETADLFGKLGTCASLVWLQDVKKSQIYKDIDGMGSWESFCNHLGKSRRYIDEQLQNLATFGEDFLAHGAGLKVGAKDLRKLRKSISNGDMTIEGEFVVIGEEKIPLSPDYKEDLEAAFESLVEERDRKIEESKTAMKAKDRVLEAKQKVIVQQEKELSKFTKDIEARDYKPGEKEFIKHMENKQMIITGMFLELDPERLPEDATPIMISKYIEVLAYFKRTAVAYLDTALEGHAQPDDIEWKQPGLALVEKD